MFGKLFKKKESTMIVGEKTRSINIKGVLPVVAYITFPRVRGGISENIESKLTIGSEVGDLIIDDPSVSPRHCTFLVSKDVVSVIDHASEEGTFINKKALDPGKTFFVHEKDKIKIGNVDALIEFKELPMAVALQQDDIEGETFEDTNELSADALEEMVESEGTAELDSPPEFDYKVPTLGDETDDLDIGEMDLGQPDESAGLQLDDAEPALGEDEEEEEEESRAPEMAEYTMKTAKGLKLEGQKTENKELDYYIPEPLPMEEKAKTSFLSKLFFWRKKKDKPAPVKINKKKGAGKKKKIKVVKPPVSSGIIRIFALCIDLLFALSLHIMASPIEEYKTFFENVPGMLQKEITPLFKEHVAVHYEKLFKDFSFVQDIVDKIAEFEFLNLVLSFFFLIMTVRVITTLILKVSLGQFLLGIREKQSSFIVGRLKGVFREFLGMITTPLLIFDLTTLINKRSLKEVLSFTRLTTPFPFATTIMTVLWLPTFGLLFMAAPLFKGFEIKDPILVDDVPVRKVKPWGYEKKVYSNVLDLQYDLQDKVKTLPLVEISLKDGKKLRQYGLVFYDLNRGSLVEVLKVYENIKLTKIFYDYVKENPTASFFQPKIYEVAKNAALNSENFTTKIEDSDVLKIGVEMKSLLKNSFSLELATLPNFIYEEGVMFRGHVNFRENIEKLFKYPIDQIAFTNFANVPGILFFHQLGKDRFYSYMPQTSISPSIYRFSENISDIKTIKGLNFIKIGKRMPAYKDDDISALYIESLKTKKKIRNPRRLANNLAKRFKDVATYAMEKNSPRFISQVKKIISRNISSLELDKRRNSDFYRKLASILNSMNKNDYRFFGLKPPEKKSE